jgi:hypothetical protein
MKTRKITSIILVSILSILFNVQYALANNSNTEQKIISYTYAGDSLTQSELEYLSKNPDIAQKRAEKDVKYLLDLADKEMNKQMHTTATKDVSTMSTIEVALGTDKTITSCSTGNKGGEKSGVGLYASDYKASGKWADVSTTVGGIGTASSWAWVGPEIKATGKSGERKQAFITFSGKYKGGYLGGIGGSSTAKVRVSVYDLTRGAEINGATVWERTDSGSTVTKNVNQSFNNGLVSCTLEADHTYALRYGISAASTEYGPYVSSTDFWDTEGLDATSVVIDF